MLHGVITLIIKDKFGDLRYSDNQRHVMSSSNFLKVFEYGLLHRIEFYINLDDRQHVYGKRYSTSSAKKVLKVRVFY